MIKLNFFIYLFWGEMKRKNHDISTHKRKCFRYYLFFNAEFDIFKGSLKKLSHLQNDILVSKWHLRYSSRMITFRWRCQFQICRVVLFSCCCCCFIVVLLPLLLLLFFIFEIWYFSFGKTLINPITTNVPIT